MNVSARPLRDALRARGATFRSVCAAAVVCHSGFSQVLAGKRPGRRTWLRLAPYLHEAEKKIACEIFGPEIFEHKKTKAPNPE